MTDADADADGSAARDAPSRLGRSLFAGGLAFLAAKNLQNLDGRVEYADASGVPFAEALVPAASGLLLAGGVGIGLWRRPKLAAGSVVAFLVGVTPVMHDFWNADGADRDGELTSFAQNLTLLGAALAFFGWARGE